MKAAFVCSPLQAAAGSHLAPRSRCETLWCLVKRHWLCPQAYATFTTLCANVTSILNTVGLNYRVSFSWMLSTP